MRTGIGPQSGDLSFATSRVLAIWCIALSLIQPSCAWLGIARGEEPDANSTRSELPTIHFGDAAGIEPEIRVRIAAAKNELAIGGTGELTAETQSPAPLIRAAKRPVRITRSGRQWILASDGGLQTVLASHSALTPVPIRLADSSGQGIGIDGMILSGRIVLHPRDDISAGAFDVIEHVGIESYLTGVVAKELYKDWSPAAYEAQAIAARSYALHERARQRSLNSHYDVEGSTQDQAYGGATGHTPAHVAVRKTRGRVILFEGSVLRAYYSSTCAGRAASARDVWPTNAGFEFNLLAPIQASPRLDGCTFSPFYRWNVVRTRDELTTRIRAYAARNNMAIRSIKRINRVEVETVNEFKRPQTYKVFDQDGRWWSVEAEELRGACNFAEGIKLPLITRETRVHSGDLSMQIEGEQVKISGRGFGHGVGMCQFGCEAMARRGATPDEILIHFYPNTTIQRLY